MRRGRQSLRNHILDKGYLAQAMELLQARQSSLQLHILVKRQISDPILFLRLSHKPPSNTCLLPNLLGNMTIQQETQNQALIQPVTSKTKMGQRMEGLSIPAFHVRLTRSAAKFWLRPRLDRRWPTPPGEDRALPKRFGRRSIARAE